MTKQFNKVLHLEKYDLHIFIFYLLPIPWNTNNLMIRSQLVYLLAVYK